MKKEKRFFSGIATALAISLFVICIGGCAGCKESSENLTIGSEKTETDSTNDLNDIESGAEADAHAAEGNNGAMNLVPSLYAESDFDTSGKIHFRTEYEIIDKRMERIAYTIENLSGKDLEYGEEYVLEIKSGEQWYQVPFPENYAWNAIAHVLPANNISGGLINLEWMDFEYVDGAYRVVKQLGDYLVKAEFSMGESEITPETPFGYEALEELPLEYTIEDAIEDGVVVFGYQDSFNLERLKDFVVKSKLGIPTMVRIGFSTIEGDPIFYDLTRNVTEDGREWYTLYHDSRRDQFMYEENRVITKENFSYLVTDGVDIYFSNCAGYEESELFYESGISIAASAYLNQPDLIEEIVNRWEHLDSIELNAEAKLYREIIGLIEEMTNNRLEGNVTRFKSFSPEGTYYVSLNEEQLKGGISFGYGTKGYGTSDYAIRGQNADESGVPELTDIIRVDWVDDETARFLCSTTNVGKNCCINFSPKAAIDGEDAFSEKVYVNIND